MREVERASTDKAQRSPTSSKQLARDTRRILGCNKHVRVSEEHQPTARSITDAAKPALSLSCNAMPVIIDTYNVLHVEGVLPPEMAGVDVDGLAALIAQSRFGSDAIWLICDGVPSGARRSGRIVIEGSGHKRTADDHIISLLQRDSAPRRMTVVTSDRALRQRAKALGAELLKSEEFLSTLAKDAAHLRKRAPSLPDPRRSVPLSEREAHGWMRLFGITAAHAAIESAPRATTPPPLAATRDSMNITPSPPKRGAARAIPEQPVVLAEVPATKSHETPALRRYRLATKEVADPLAILDGRSGRALLEALSELDDASIDALMRAHEPSLSSAATEKSSERVEAKKRTGQPARKKKSRK
jgi:hypothetical protein